MYATVRRYEGVTNPRVDSAAVCGGPCAAHQPGPRVCGLHWVDAGGVMVSTSIFDTHGAVSRRARLCPEGPLALESLTRAP